MASEEAPLKAYSEQQLKDELLRRYQDKVEQYKQEMKQRHRLIVDHAGALLLLTPACRHECTYDHRDNCLHCLLRELLSGGDYVLADEAHEPPVCLDVELTLVRRFGPKEPL